MVFAVFRTNSNLELFISGESTSSMSNKNRSTKFFLANSVVFFNQDVSVGLFSFPDSNEGTSLPDKEKKIEITNESKNKE